MAHLCWRTKIIIHFYFNLPLIKSNLYQKYFSFKTYVKSCQSPSQRMPVISPSHAEKNPVSYNSLQDPSAWSPSMALISS